jgi:hypothetical protein
MISIFFKYKQYVSPSGGGAGGGMKEEEKKNVTYPDLPLP